MLVELDKPLHMYTGYKQKPPATATVQGIDFLGKINFKGTVSNSVHLSYTN